MLQEVEKLLALQDRDQRLRNLRQEYKSVPGELAALKKLVADSTAKLEASKARAKAIEVEKKSLEMEVAAKKEQIARYKTQQLQTRKNDEYMALSHEISAAEKFIREIEDKELVLMEEADALAPQIAEAEKTFADEKARIDGRITVLGEREANLSSRIAEMETARPASTEGIDEDLLEQYEHLFESKNGRAVVPVEHDVCGGCHMKVTAQTGLALRSDKSVISCPQCGRILYLPA